LKCQSLHMTMTLIWTIKNINVALYRKLYHARNYLEAFLKNFLIFATHFYFWAHLNQRVRDGIVITLHLKSEMQVWYWNHFDHLGNGNSQEDRGGLFFLKRYILWKYFSSWVSIFMVWLRITISWICKLVDFVCVPK
jgi:hypothetical protein